MIYMLTNQQASINVLFVGSHDRLRASLANLMSIQADMKLIGTVFSPHEAVDQVTKLNPDVILMDLSIAEMENLSPIRKVHRAYPNTHIIAMSGFPRKELVDNMMNAGVKRYIKRGDSAHAIVNAIRDVCRIAKEDEGNITN